MEIPPAGGRDDGGSTAGDGDLRLPPPQHCHTVYCNQGHYEPVSGGGAETGATVLQAVVVSVQGGCGGDADGGLGCRTDIGGGGDGRDRDIYILSWWEDNVANLTLGMDPNISLAYALRLERHHLIMGTLGENGGQL